MRAKRTFFKVDLARNYVKKFPNTQSHSLAKKMYLENTEHFKDAEDARSSIRYARGLMGDTKRKKSGTQNQKLFIPPFSLRDNPYSLPKSYAEKPKVFSLPLAHNNILFISDLHIPYHDIQALSVAIKYGIENNINTIFINGDLLDFYQISRFTNIQRKRSVAQELETAKEILDILNKNFPNVPIYFLKGNHDNRLEMYLATKAPELLDIEEFRLEKLLDADKHNMLVLEDTTLVKIGKLNVTHGHLIIRGIFAPVSAARGAFLRAKASTIISHVHKVSTHSETTIGNKNITCYSTGCMCELSPAYNPFGNNFSHGFSHITTTPNGHYKVRNMQIINGEIVS